jgi:hypothetical protein
VNVQNIRPDRVYATGVIAPYPLRQDSPIEIAMDVLWPFIHVVRPTEPTAGYSPSPMTVAKDANDLARAIQQGIRPAPGTDNDLLCMAMKLLKGESFAICSGGRTVVVSSTPGAGNVQVQEVAPAQAAQAAGGTGTTQNTVAQQGSPQAATVGPGGQADASGGGTAGFGSARLGSAGRLVEKLQIAALIGRRMGGGR